MFAPSSSMEVTVRSRYPPGCCQPQMPAPEISPSNLSWNFHRVVENPEDKPVCWVAGLRDWTGPSMATWLWFSMVLRLLMVSLGREAGREGVAESTQHCQTTQHTSHQGQWPTKEISTTKTFKVGSALVGPVPLKFKNNKWISYWSN